MKNSISAFMKSLQSERNAPPAFEEKKKVNWFKKAIEVLFAVFCIGMLYLSVPGIHEVMNVIQTTGDPLSNIYLSIHLTLMVWGLSAGILIFFPKGNRTTVWILMLFAIPFVSLAVLANTGETIIFLGAILLLMIMVRITKMVKNKPEQADIL